jgi:CPA2 family monovalent cation:H+ antiporter-2
VPIVLADATRIPVLKALGIERARLIVLAVNDGAATTRIAQVVRQIAPHVHVLARASYIAEVERLQQMGAHEVVPQELEASVEILVRVLRRFLVPDDEVGRQVAAVRQSAYGIPKMAAIAGGEAASIAELVPGLGLAVFKAAADSEAGGRTVADVGVRKRTGCSVIAIRRDGKNLVVIAPETQFLADDVIVVIGPEARLADAGALFHTRGGRQAAVAPALAAGEAEAK